MKKLLGLVLVSMLAVSSSVVSFADTVTDTKQNIDINMIMPRAVLLEETDVSDSDGHYVTTEFATPSGNSNKINVYFDNQGTTDVTVTLQKKGLLGTWSKVDSFSVASGKNPYKAMTGASSTTYRVKIDDNVSGAKIIGHLRVNQLES